MIKTAMLRKVLITSVILLIIMLAGLIFNDREFSTEVLKRQELKYIMNNQKQTVIYLLNDNDYLVKTNVMWVDNPTTIEDKAKQLLSMLSEDNTLIPSGFKPIIPKKTNIIDLKYTSGLLTVNFSKELLKVPAKYEEKMVEAIVYNLTNLVDVNEVSIYVDGAVLTRLPQTGVYLPAKLNRCFGINKTYDLNTIHDVASVTLYYVNKTNNNSYYIPITKYLNGKREKIKIIIDELSGGPIYETNLMSFLNSNAELLNYEQMDNKLILDFNHYIFSDMNDRNILEEVSYAIAYSIFDNYDVDEVIFSVDQEIITTVVKRIE